MEFKEDDINLNIQKKYIDNNQLNNNIIKGNNFIKNEIDNISDKFDNVSFNKTGYIISSYGKEEQGINGKRLKFSYNTNFTNLDENISNTKILEQKLINPSQLCFTPIQKIHKTLNDNILNQNKYYQINK
jgi:hypothetical protein